MSIEPEGSDKSNTNLLEVFAERLKFEHDVIGQRMTWLMTLNGFLVGGGAVLVANRDKFSGSYGLTGTLFLVGLLGALSNASCLFSNYWATRAIRETGAALLDAWRDLPDSEQENLVSRMRLYGRDPKSFRGPSRASPSQPLHPWIFLPGMFMVFFGSIPLFLNGLSATDLDLPEGMLVVLGVLLSAFIVLPIWEIRYKNRRTVLASIVGRNGEWPGWQERRRLYREEARKVAAWVADDSDPRGESKMLSTSRFGLIPMTTYREYQDHLKASRLNLDPPRSRFLILNASRTRTKESP